MQPSGTKEQQKPNSFKKSLTYRTRISRLTATGTLETWLSGKVPAKNNDLKYLADHGKRIQLRLRRINDSRWSIVLTHVHTHTRVRGMIFLTHNRYPLPFTKLDYHNTYNLIWIWQSNECKTTFTGHYECLVIPIELMNMPLVFQHLNNEVLWEALDRYENAWLDDIFIFSRNSHEHVRHVWRVLQHLLKHHLFVNPSSMLTLFPSWGLMS